MGIITQIINHHKEKVKWRNETCTKSIDDYAALIKQLEVLFENESEFIDSSMIDSWKLNYHQVEESMNLINQRRLKRARNYTKLKKLQTTLKNKYEFIQNDFTNHNDKVAKIKIDYVNNTIRLIEGIKLDDQQSMCIAKDVYNHLVLAGAGTGKTTTIIGKIKYLLKSNAYKSEDILVLSFTNASATEMSERIKKECECNIQASTFHKLGLNIIKEVKNKYPKIRSNGIKQFVRAQLQKNIEDKSYLKILNEYLMYHKVNAKSEFDFSCEEEYNNYLSLNPPTTLKKEVVKSYGEMDIANFLFEKGIRYIYEKPYYIDTCDEEYGQYNPDFYLPEYNIYIEYFGIDRKGNVPKYFKSRHGGSASSEYNESIQWKRNLHKKQNTSLIECFAYEKMEGCLLRNLEKNLKKLSINLIDRDTFEIWKEISQSENSLIDGLVELFETVINLIKSNNYTVNDLRRLNQKDGKGNKSNDLIITLIEPIFEAYQKELNDNQEIDFNDMINIATQYVIEGKYKHSYKYVIVDEYQDISQARFNLLNEMRKSNPFKLFCVGDDWQSIYRFAGSDIGFILDFEKYWGFSEVSKIETTYRFSQSLIDISGSFIMKNPKQKKKSIKGKLNSNEFALGEINGYTEDYACQFMLKRLDDLPMDSSIFFIGRYSFDKNFISNNSSFKLKYNNENKMIDVIYEKRKDLKIKFISAHKSKGLQADYVFIINNKRGKMGFPSQIQDAPILKLLLSYHDEFLFAEERRLFYVALTRAKVKAFIVTVKNNESSFANELKKDYKKAIKLEAFKCPKCGGKLLKRNGPYGTFYGCSNYSKNGCTYKRT